MQNFWGGGGGKQGVLWECESSETNKKISRKSLHVAK